ncbi:hypothetical protein L1987_59043 [Smallanthus sonchifolius]|uniref:Uncharacterized protein n=1 Tax=Smallanthus sonchifolius TaxID=185202 RepID=A0ACB9D4R3_9ASTR|nr:hypothetical protein L1987_59043 [Smallanthus sonchifolius]
MNQVTRRSSRRAQGWRSQWRFPTTKEFGSEIIPASAQKYHIKVLLHLLRVGYFLLQLEHGHQMSVGPMELWLKVANLFRGSGWPDGAVVFALATLPVIELRGAIHVGYWLQLNCFTCSRVTPLSQYHFHYLCC